MARPELLDDRPGWAGGKLNATSILLEPLNTEECGRLVTNLLADDSVDAVVGERIAQAAEGHPLYAEEITGLLVDEGRLVLKEGRWTADRRSCGPAGPTDDLGRARGTAGQAAPVRAGADRGRVGDGAGLLSRGRPRTLQRGVRHERRHRRTRPQAVRPPRAFRPVGDGGARVPAPADPRRGLQLDPEVDAGGPPRAVRAVARPDGRRLGRGGRDRRLPLGAGAPVPRRARTDRRSNADARSRGGRAARSRGSPGLRAQGPFCHGEPLGASGRPPVSAGSAPARAPRGSGARAVADGSPARGRRARRGDRRCASDTGPPGRGDRGRAEGVRADHARPRRGTADVTRRSGAIRGAVRWMVGRSRGRRSADLEWDHPVLGRALRRG